MAATLIPANQNSNSPNELTETRLVAVMSDINTSESSHNGMSGAQNWITFPPATASNPITMTQKYQYSQRNGEASPAAQCGPGIIRK